MRRFVMSLLLTSAIAGAAEDRFDRIAKNVVEYMNAVDADSLYRMYDPAMKNALPVAKTKEVMQGLQAQFGNIRKIESSQRPSPMTGRFRLQLERGVLDMEVTLNADDTLSGLFLR